MVDITSCLKQALEALEPHKSTVLRWVTPVDQAITNLRAAIEQMEKVEPVAWIHHISDNEDMEHTIVDFNKSHAMSVYEGDVPLYTHPAPAVPEELNRDLDEFNEVGQAYDQGWNDCRKSMLRAAPTPEGKK